LISLEGGLARGDITHLSRGWRAYPGNGFVRLEVPDSPADVAGYCAKYMAKDGGDLFLSEGIGRQFPASRGRLLVAHT
jgi:hypothetical protein